MSGYHWSDGIGPADDRPRRSELAWHSEESNRFGTDEFLAWCQTASVEPVLCLNMGTGTGRLPQRGITRPAPPLC